jgi:pyruvate/2-oxoglutarate dehydrogenase complex dihydrolipoamide acyltransferase (E2) component
MKQQLSLLGALVLLGLLSLASFSATAQEESAGTPEELRSDEESSEGETLTVEAVDKLPLKEIRKELKARGVACSDCMEKDHFASKLKEAIVNKVTPKSKASTPEPTPKAEPPKNEGATNQMSEEDRQNLLKELRKKRDEQKKMRDALRKAGIDPSTIKGDGFGNGFGGDAFEKFLEEEEKREALKKGKGKEGKGKGKDKSSKEGKGPRSGSSKGKKQEEAKPIVTSDDDGAISDEL